VGADSGAVRTAPRTTFSAFTAQPVTARSPTFVCRISKRVVLAWRMARKRSNRGAVRSTAPRKPTRRWAAPVPLSSADGHVRPLAGPSPTVRQPLPRVSASQHLVERRHRTPGAPNSHHCPAPRQGEAGTLPGPIANRQTARSDDRPDARLIRLHVPFASVRRQADNVRQHRVDRRGNLSLTATLRKE
jgi:hypothetical protein